MIRPLAVALALTLTSAAAAQTPAYTVQASTIGELLDNPDTKAVLNRHIPQVVAHPQINEGRPMTLPQIVEYVPELTPDLLARINADLAAMVKR
jgi:para-nitrobenzyl esterase